MGTVVLSKGLDTGVFIRISYDSWNEPYLGFAALYFLFIFCGLITFSFYHGITFYCVEGILVASSFEQL